MKEELDKLLYEKQELENGAKYVAGVDEVGRGPLAGPVVCSAVILPLDDIIEGVDDSKKLSKKKRELLYDKIIEKAISYSICQIEPKEIDEINILQATKKCMANAINNLKVKPDIVLVDAVDNLDISVPAKAIIKGDALSYVIGASSTPSYTLTVSLLSAGTTRYISLFSFTIRLQSSISSTKG